MDKQQLLVEKGSFVNSPVSSPHTIPEWSWSIDLISSFPYYIDLQSAVVYKVDVRTMLFFLLN